MVSIGDDASSMHMRVLVSAGESPSGWTGLDGWRRGADDVINASPAIMCMFKKSCLQQLQLQMLNVCIMSS